ncbi:MAG TPA: SemiSWEET family transporter [Patescibacteria group bacterium]|nr:SemiSWEET family transporter [Patescibacteria group bacterium]
MHIFYKSKKDHYKEEGMHVLDKVIFPIALISPIMTVPQVLQVWQKHETAGLAITTWIGFAFASTFWTLYGLAHKDKAIVASSATVVVLDILIVLGILMQK